MSGTAEKDNGSLVGLPTDEHELVPVGVRAMMTVTNRLYGSF